MDGNGSRMSGEVIAGLGRRALAARLSRSGLIAEVRDSSHFEGGEYIRIRVDDDVNFSLEMIAAGEYLVHADADSIERMIRASSVVSMVLTDLDIRHRFEVEGDDPRVDDYLHHRWP